MKNMTVNQYLFMQWTAKTYPQLYHFIVGNPRETTLAGWGDVISNGLKSLLSEAPKLAATYLATKAQADALKANVKRAEQNLPPIDPATGQVITPQTPGYAVPANVGVPSWALIAGGVALLGVVILIARK
jgi:hypothetical protein